MKRGRIVIISGPSGVGKSTICKEVVRRLEDVYLSVSVTTRPRAKGEADGSDYWFVTREQFEERIKKGMLLEYAEVFGNLYGTPKDKLDEVLRAGKISILEIDVQGARQVGAIYPDAIMIFILPPSQGELARRISGRGREKAEAAEKRLDNAGVEMVVGERHYQYKVVNDNLKKAVNEVIQIIQQSTGGGKK